MLRQRRRRSYYIEIILTQRLMFQEVVGDNDLLIHMNYYKNKKSIDNIKKHFHYVTLLFS